MAEHEQEVVLEPGGIEVEIATDPQATQAQVTTTPAASEPAEAVAGVEELQRQIKALEQREAAALRERQHQEQLARENAAALARAQEEIARANGQVVDTRRASFESQIVAAQAEADIARRDYQLAMEQGNFAQAADANLRLNKAASQVTLLEDKKQNFDHDTRLRMENGGAVRQPAQPQRSATDELESFVANKPPRTQQWLRAHPETMTDPRLNNKTVSAHYAALAEGYVPDTDSYFEFVDRQLGFGAARPTIPAQAEPEEQVRRPTPKAAPPAAPVSRDPVRSERSTGRIYLSRGEQETAEALGLTHAEYGRRKAAMEKQGYYHS